MRAEVSHLLPGSAGRYEARAEATQGLDLNGGKILNTRTPQVVWVTDEGQTVTAWRGTGYWADGVRAKRGEKAALLQARNKCAVLRNYLKLNGQRWEVVRAEERVEAEAKERQERRAREHVRRLAPKLLTALQAVLRNPDDAAARAAAEAIAADAENAPQSEAEFRERHAAHRKAGAA